MSGVIDSVTDSNPLQPGPAADAALAEWVYYRDSKDQGLSLNDILGDATVVDVRSGSNSLPEFTYANGFYYAENGFCAAIVQRDGYYTIVFRGTDTASLTSFDKGDVVADIMLGKGQFYSEHQGGSTIRLADALLKYVIGNGGTADKIHAVGQSLGGGLAGLAATYLNVAGTLINPAPFGKSVYNLSVLSAVNKYNDDIAASNLINGFDRTKGQISIPDGLSIDLTLMSKNADSPTTLGDFIAGLYGQEIYDKIGNMSDQIFGDYYNFIGSDKVKVYRTKGELLSDGTGGGALGLGGSFSFKGATELYDLGEGSQLSLHSPTLSALEMRSIEHDKNEKSGTSKEFGKILRDDAVFRDAIIGDTTAVAGSKGHERADQGSPTSKVKANETDVGVLERALFKSIGSKNSLYADFFDLFDNTLRHGAVADGLSTDTINSNTVHAGIVRLALSVVRDLVHDTKTLADVEKNFKTHKLDFSLTNLDSASDKGSFTIDLFDLTNKDYGSSAPNGLPYGVNDLNHYIWDSLKKISSENVISSATKHTEQEVFGSDTYADNEVVPNGDAKGLGWDIVKVQAGSDHDPVSFKPDAGKEDRNYLFIGGGGDDVVIGGNENNIIMGGAGNDRLFGGYGDDILVGGDGDDIISGGGGNDVATGGAGADVFIVDGNTDNLVILDADTSDRIYVKANAVGRMDPGGSADYTFAASYTNSGLPLVGGHTDYLEAGMLFRPAGYHEELPYPDDWFRLRYKGALQNYLDTNLQELKITVQDTGTFGHDTSIDIINWSDGVLGITSANLSTFAEFSNNYEFREIPDRENPLSGASGSSDRTGQSNNNGGPNSNNSSGSGGNSGGGTGGTGSGGTGSGGSSGGGAGGTGSGGTGSGGSSGGGTDGTGSGGTGDGGSTGGTGSGGTGDGGSTGGTGSGGTGDGGSTGGTGSGGSTGGTGNGGTGGTGTGSSGQPGDPVYTGSMGTSGDDVITGTRDNDVLTGGDGNDTYLYKSGDGNDRIVEHWAYYQPDQTNNLKFVDLTPTQVSVSSVGDDLVVTDTTTGQAIAIEGGFGQYDGVKTIAFADGTVWDRATMVANAAVRGTAGNDTLKGSNRDDVLIGGSGNDILTGGDGNDTYLYKSGDGNDRIVEHWTYYQPDQTNNLKFVDLTPTQVSVSSVGDDLVVTDTTTGQAIAIEGGFSQYDGVKTIAFADGTIWDRATMVSHAAVRGTSGNDTLKGSNRDDVLIGGSGNDILSGGDGNDTYLYKSGDGNDRIVEHWTYYQPDQTNTLKLVDLTPTQVSVSSVGNDLVVTDTTTGQAITIEGGFGQYDGVKTIAFADGTVWDRSAIAGNTTIAGTAGNDTLQGSSRDDVIVGGHGDDRLIGGDGNDTYLYKSGDGNDHIVEHWAYYQPDQANTLKLVDLTPAQISVSSAGDDLVVTDTTTGQAITIEGGSGQYDGVKTIAFADGIVWDRATIVANTAVRGTPGNDVLNGSNRDDVLDGGRGDDRLIGGDGSDTYLYKSGDGNDRIVEHWAYYQPDQANTLKLVDLGPTQVSVSSAGDDLVVTDTTTGQTVTIEGGFGQYDGVKTIAFADGTVWDRATMVTHAAVRGTAGNDTLTGSNRDDVLDGGRGDDTLTGGDGSDTYLYRSGDGNDRIVEHWAYYQPDQANALKLVDLTPTKVSISSIGDDLVVTDTTTGQAVTIEGGFGQYDGIKTIAFADGTVWDRATMVANAAIRGTTGNDLLKGSSRDDMIIGDRGDDTLTGGDGNDTYLYKSGDGNDRIVEHWAYYQPDQNNALKLADLSADQVSLWEIVDPTPNGNSLPGSLVVTDNTTGQTILVENGFGQYDGVKSIIFKDGTLWNRDTIVQKSLDTSKESYVYYLGRGSHAITGDEHRIIFLRGLTAADTQIARDGNSLVITVKPSNDKIWVNNAFGSAAPADGLKAIEFSDGRQFSMTDVVRRLEAGYDSLSSPSLGQSTPDNGSSPTTGSTPGQGSGDTSRLIEGTDGDDQIDVPPDGRVLHGGRGDDVFTVSGTGSNEFTFRKGDGHDIIKKSGDGFVRSDFLTFTDITSNEVKLTRSGDKLVISVPGTGDTITVTDQFSGDSSSYGINRITFSNGQTWDRLTISSNAPVRGTDGYDNVYVTGSGVYFSAEKGDDYYTHNSGETNQTYLYASGDGNDIIDVYTPAGRTDTLKLTDLNQSDVILSRSGINLLVYDKKSGQTITVKNQWYDASSARGLVSIIFADGSNLDASQLDMAAWVRGTDGYDNLYVSGSNTTLNAGKGDDYYTHNSGETNQTYIYARGDGNDIIDVYTPTGRTDTLKLTDLNKADVILSRSGINLLITDKSTNQTITVRNQWYDGSGARGLAAIRFADGSSLNAAGIDTEAWIRGSDNSDNFYASGSNVTVDAGKGDDYYNHNSGEVNQTYRYESGDGSDIIDVYTPSGRTDTLKLVDLKRSDVILSRSGINLLVTDTKTNQTITVRNQWYDSTGQRGITSIQFADSYTMDADAIDGAAWVRGTQGYDYIYAPASNINIDAGRGDDFITHNGGETGVILNYSSGDGSDILDLYTSAGRADVLKLRDLNSSDVSLSRSGSSLLITNKSLNETITVRNQWSDAPGTGGLVSVEFANGDRINAAAIDAQVWVYGTDGNDNLSGSGGNDVLFGGKGDDRLSGGRGSDLFVFGPASGHDTINDFETAGGNHDLIQFDHNVFADASSVLAASTQVGDDVVITATPKDDVILKGVQLNTLTSDNFRIS